MNTTLLFGLAAAAWVLGAYYFFYLRGKGTSLIPGTGVLRSDEDVLVLQKKFVVNVVYSEGQVVSQDLLADLVVNVSDLMQGKYKPLNFEGIQTTIVSGDPKKKVVEVEEQGGDEEEITLPKEDEDVPDTIEENDIPEPETKGELMLEAEVLDVKNLNLNF